MISKAIGVLYTVYMMCCTKIREKSVQHMFQRESGQNKTLFITSVLFPHDHRNEGERNKSVQNWAAIAAGGLPPGPFCLAPFKKVT